jgi:hypothetical protein
MVKKKSKVESIGTVVYKIPAPSAGGARKGAGRKTIYNESTVGVSVTLPESVRNKLYKKSQRLGCSMSAVVTDALRIHLKGVR